MQDSDADDKRKSLPVFLSQKRAGGYGTFLLEIIDCNAGFLVQVFLCFV